MKSTSKTVVFFGSGPVAEASLKSLVKYFDIEAVFTKSVTADVMAQAAPQAQLYTCETKKELTDLIQVHSLKSRVGVIVDFGIIVEQAVIDAFELGIINSHFSLLPELRGADPITFSILSGQSSTGVSLMRIVPALDEGDLLVQQEMPIASDDTTPSLTKKLINLSNELLRDYLPKYLNGKLKLKPQDPSKVATYSRKLTKEDGIIDWTKPAEQLEREVRAFAGWPGSKTMLAGKEVQVIAARVLPFDEKPGVIHSTKKELVVGTRKDGLAIDQLKPAGKPVMDIAAFLAGYRQLL